MTLLAVCMTRVTYKLCDGPYHHRGFCGSLIKHGSAEFGGLELDFSISLIHALPLFMQSISSARQKKHRKGNNEPKRLRVAVDGGSYD